ncbi:MAG: biotin/lipoyl-binding protein [Oscillospiraceae bacterium]|nr:biotin/lipoyl-binding protein [Oscillospiraceae bacterium]
METKEIKENANPRNRREWVKNIIIVFLLVMLLLTFFSNTIMNYSLPEVSVTRMSRDSVSRSYELDLMIEANKTYDVTADETRDIKRVAVKRGQEIKEGQVIFYLEQAEDSAEAKQLEETIKTSKLAYEKAIMTLANDYFAENQAISQARDALNNAIAARDEANSVAPPVDNSGRLLEIMNLMAGLQADLGAIDGGKYSEMSAERYALFSESYEKYISLNDECVALNQKIANDTAKIAGQDETMMQRNLDKLKTELERLREDGAAQRIIEDKQTEVTYAEEDLKKLQDTKTAIADNQKLVSEKEPLMLQSKTEYETKLNEIKASLNSQLQSLGNEKEMLSSEEMGPGSTVPNGIDYDGAVRDAQYALDAAVHTLEEKMKADQITDAQAQLELNAQKESIEELEAELAEILAEQTSTEIVSPVDGVVETINVTSGQTCAEGESLMILNISDDGFTATTTLDNDKGKVLKKGDEAKVLNNYDDITVTVKSIAKDKNDSSKFKVTFAVSGEGAVAGQNIKIELGERSSTFDSVLPRSAVKQDSEGYFVYAVKSKSTPLGNRYIVEKIAVSIVAQDDVHYAVSGEFGESADYVITASSKPLKAGDQVRFAEE